MLQRIEQLHRILLTAYFVLVFTNFSHATIWNVDPSGTYTSPNALYMADLSGDIAINDFDTIHIIAGDYVGTDALAAWQQNNLYIKGIEGQPQMIADGENILGKGIWVCVGNNITIENIEFSGATVPDENGAGIRLDGIGLTVRYCYFHENENGILTSNPYDGDIIIEYSEFAYNGFGDGYTHNIYVGHVNSLIMRFCYSHHTFVGHNLKSRANYNTIVYNRIMDEETGNSSRLIDLPNGGTSLLKGNTLMQGVNAINNNVIGYGLEGLTNTSPHHFSFVNNTIVNKREASCKYLHIAEGSEDVYVVNNIFAGTGNVIDGEATTLTNNYHNVEIDHFYFQNEPEYDYQLTILSPVIDSGFTVIPELNPDFHYIHPLTAQERLLEADKIDIGAYEYAAPLAIYDISNLPFKIHPNPANKVLNISLPNDVIDEKLAVQVISLSGKIIFNSQLLYSPFSIDVHELAPGTYIVRVFDEHESSEQKLIVH